MLPGCIDYYKYQVLLESWLTALDAFALSLYMKPCTQHHDPSVMGIADGPIPHENLMIMLLRGVEYPQSCALFDLRNVSAL